MRRISVFIVFLCVNLLVFAADKTTGVSIKQTIAEEDFVAYIKQTESMLENLKSIQGELDKLKKDTADIGARNRVLEGINPHSNANICEMLVSYPLTVKYDSSLIDFSLKVIRIFEVNKQKDNKKFCSLMLPVLINYKAYSQSVYDMIFQIDKSYLSLNREYDIERFKSRFDETKYYKECCSKSIFIPYLDDIKHEVEDLLKEGKLTKENIREILKELK